MSTEKVSKRLQRMISMIKRIEKEMDRQHEERTLAIARGDK